MSNKIKVYLTQDGLLRAVEIPTRLTKDSYKNVKLECSVPVMEDVPDEAYVKFYASGISASGQSTWSSQAYPMVYQKTERYDKTTYRKFAATFPQEFCTAGGEVFVNFAYVGIGANEEEVVYLQTTTTLNLYVIGEGYNNSPVVLPQQDLIVARTNLLSQIAKLKINVNNTLPLETQYTLNGYKTPGNEFYPVTFNVPVENGVNESKTGSVAALAVVPDEEQPAVIGCQTEFFFHDDGICKRVNKYNISQAALDNYVLLENGTWEVVNKRYLDSVNDAIDADLSSLHTQANANSQDIQNLYDIVNTGVNLVGQYPYQASMPTNAELNAYVQETADRAPQRGDRVTFVQAVEGVDKTYNIDYSAATQTWIATLLPGLGTANNGEYGSVIGTDNTAKQTALANGLVKMLVDITGGEIKDIKVFNQNVSQIVSLIENAVLYDAAGKIKATEIYSADGNLVKQTNGQVLLGNNTKIVVINGSQPKIQYQWVENGVTKQDTIVLDGDIGDLNDSAFGNKTLVEYVIDTYNATVTNAGNISTNASRIEEVNTNAVNRDDALDTAKLDKTTANDEFISSIAYSLNGDSTVATITFKNLLTKQTRTLQAQIVGAASEQNPGLMTAEMVQALIDAIADIRAMQNSGRQLKSFDTYADAELFDWSTFTGTVGVNDYFIVVEDENHAYANTKYTCTSVGRTITTEGNFEYSCTISTVRIQVADSSSLGGILSTNTPGYIYVEATGNAKLVGYDNLTTAITNLQTDLASEVSRAQGAESTLQSNITAEAARAAAAEQAESARAQAAEQSLNQSKLSQTQSDPLYEHNALTRDTLLMSGENLNNIYYVENVHDSFNLGTYKANTTTLADSITNKPIATSGVEGFILKVERSRHDINSYDSFIQTYKDSSGEWQRQGNYFYVADGNNSAGSILWEAWKNVATVDQIPTQLNQLAEDNTHRTVTDTEKTFWDNKIDKTDPTGTGSLSLNRRVSTTIGDYSAAVGYNNEACGDCSFSEGNQTYSAGSNSHAEGLGDGSIYINLTGAAEATTFTYSNAAPKVGMCIKTDVPGIYAKIISVESGTVTTDKKISDSAISAKSYQIVRGISYGQSSHCEGDKTTASGDGSHAEGLDNYASGQYSHAEGYQTTASESFAHSEGSHTIASGSGSHAEGLSTKASGYRSHAEGLNTIAQRASQHVFGEYNIADTKIDTGYVEKNMVSRKGSYVEIVGNGTADSSRSNARTLDWHGNEVLQGTSQAAGFKTPSGTASEFLKANGSVDTNQYLTASDISNPNLLINGDFQVNQRGLTTYTDTNKYTVDRWVQRENGIVTVLNRGVRLESVGATHICLNQSLEDYAPLFGKTLTLSMKVTAISGSNFQLRATAANASYLNSLNITTPAYITSIGTYSITFDFDASSMNNYSRFNVGVYAFAGGAGEYIEIEYIKLEVGSVATPFSPKPYVQEFNDCLRYFQRYRGNIPAIAASSKTELYPEISCPTKLRVVPTVTIVTDYVIRGNGTLISGNPTIAISTSNADLASNGMELQVGGLGQVFTQYQCYSLHNGKLNFDAEIY